MRSTTTSFAGPAHTSEPSRGSGWRRRRLLLRPEDQLSGPVLLGNVDGGVLQGCRQLLRHEDFHTFLLGDLVAGNRLMGEAEADGDLARLSRLGEDSQAVLLRDILALAELSEQRRGATGDLEHNLSLGWFSHPGAARPIPA